ncbi:MAG: Uma2 family endonuclease [Pirellulales bacterium]|nr:Uma2 family endonuclease [Pirellulales bacterium]
MTMLIKDPRLEESLIESRRRTDADRWDEVWEGVYIVSPQPNNEHQKIVIRLGSILEEVVDQAGLGDVFPGVNLSDQEEDWEFNYRAPDVAVFLKSGKAVDCGTYWRGPADFLVEIVSPNDATYEKIPFYDKLGVVELLIVDRDPWKLELYARRDGRLQKTGESNLENRAVLQSDSVGLSFQLAPGKDRPQIAVEHSPSGKRWMA